MTTFYTDNGPSYKCSVCEKDIIGEIGHECGSFSFLDKPEEDIYTEEDGEPMEGSITLEEIKKRQQNKYWFVDRIDWENVWSDLRFLLDEVKRFRNVIDSVSQSDLISYSVKKELREALEEGKQGPPCP